MKSRTHFIIWSSSLLLILVIMTLIDSFVHNLYPVIPGEIYRSRQLSKAQFAETIHTYHLKSIINLRGLNPKDTWYQNEIAISKQDGIKHYNLALNSETLPTPAQFKKLVYILQTAPRPLLVHCESGVDRSGFAAAVSLILAGKPLSEAERQVSWHYFVIHHDSIGKQFIRLYQQWLKQQKLTSSKIVFLHWLAQYPHQAP